MNKVILTGNLVNECELRTTQSGKNVISNTIAVRRDFKNPNGEYETDFINFVAWDTLAQYLIKYSHKGDRIELVGRWNTRQYTNKDGINVTVNEVLVESITSFNKPDTTKKEEKPKEEATVIDESDLPF